MKYQDLDINVAIEFKFTFKPNYWDGDSTTIGTLPVGERLAYTGNFSLSAAEQILSRSNPTLLWAEALFLIGMGLAVFFA